MRHDPEPLHAPEEPDAQPDVPSLQHKAQDEAVEALEGTLEARMEAVHTKTAPEEAEAHRRRMAALEIRLDLLQQKDALLKMADEGSRVSPEYVRDPKDYEGEPDEGKVIPQALARIRETNKKAFEDEARIREVNKKAFEDLHAIVPPYIIERLQADESGVQHPSSGMPSPSRFEFKPDPYTHREMLRTVSTSDLLSELVRRGAAARSGEADVTGEATSPENIDDQKEQR